MKAIHEILSTKDSNNILQFHKDDYFMDEDGILKMKYNRALNKLHKDKVVKLNAKFDYTENKWNWFWSFIG
jgi:hypothetical protein